ncbi:MAG: hypothetical protein AAGJ92_04255 [Pseudomonadota bacterium]
MAQTLTTARSFLPAAASLLGLALHWQAVARSRAALRGLDAARLEDLGIGQDAAEREAARPFWDL